MNTPDIDDMTETHFSYEPKSKESVEKAYKEFSEYWSQRNERTEQSAVINNQSANSPVSPTPNEKKKVSIFKHLAAIVVGLGVYFLTVIIVGIIVSFLANIPIIGQILYYPADTPWATTVIVYTTAAALSSLLSEKISGTAKPVSLLLGLYWAVQIVFMFVLGSFGWGVFIQMLFALATCFFMFFLNSD